MERLIEIISWCANPFRKGDIVRSHSIGGVTVVEVFAMPETPTETQLEIVDMWFVNIGVDKPAALQYREEIVELLDTKWEGWSGEPLKNGLSFLSFGATIGSQDLALAFMAVGKVLGFWQIVTPATLGVTGPLGDQMAGGGFVMATAFKP